MFQERLLLPTRSGPETILARRLETDAQRERNQCLDILIFARKSLKNKTTPDQTDRKTLADRIIKTNFDQSKYQRQITQFTPEELQVKRKRQLAALKGSITRAIHLTERQQKGEQLTYNQQKATNKILCLIESAVAGQSYNSWEFDKQYKLTFPRPENELPPSFQKKIEKDTPLPVLEPLQARPIVEATEPTPILELPKEPSTQKPPVIDLSDPTILKEHQSTCQQILHNIAAISNKIAKAEKPIRDNPHLYTREAISDPDAAHSRFGRRRSQLVPDKDKFQQALDQARKNVDLSVEERRIALALLKLCPADNQLIIPQSSTIKPLTNIGRFKVFLLGQKGQPVERLSSAIWENFQQGNKLFITLFKHDDTDRKNIHLDFNRSAADKYLADNPNERRQLVITGVALAATTALGITAETPAIKRIIQQAQKDAGESLAELQLKFKSWWQQRLVDFGRSDEKVSVPSEWLSQHGQLFFETGDRFIVEFRKGLWEAFIGRENLGPIHPKETLGKQAHEKLPFPETPPQLVFDYLNNRNQNLLAHALADLYYLGFFQLKGKNNQPILSHQILEHCRALAGHLSQQLQGLDPLTRIDQLNPQCRVDGAVVTPIDLARQFLFFGLSTPTSLANDICCLRHNEYESTEVVDWCLEAHRQLTATRWVEEAYCYGINHAKKPEINQLQLAIEPGGNLTSPLFDLIKKNFPGFSPEDAYTLTNWLVKQPGVIFNPNGNFVTNPNAISRGTYRLDAGWFGALYYLQERSQQHQISIGRIVNNVDLHQLGEHGFSSTPPQLESLPLLIEPVIQFNNRVNQTPPISFSHLKSLVSQMRLPEVVSAVGSWEDDIIAEINAKIPHLLARPLDHSIDSTAIYTDRNGKILCQIDPNNMRRFPIPLSQMSPNLLKALIATEGEILGVSTRGLARSISSQGEQGGSDPAQELVKIICGYGTDEQRNQEASSPELKYQRKISQMGLALILKEQLTREFLSETEADKHIAETLLNVAYFGYHHGQSVVGVEAAAKTFFGISADQLSLSQSAYIIGLIQEPSTYSSDYYKGLNRRNDILHLLANKNVISQTDLPQHLNETLTLVSTPSPSPNHLPHFIHSRVLPTLKEIYPFGFRGGTVQTTLDFDLQRRVEAIVKEDIIALAPKHQIGDGAMVIIDTDGQILAYVANIRDASDTANAPELDHISVARHPSGSTLKVFPVSSYLASDKKNDDFPIRANDLSVGGHTVYNYLPSQNYGLVTATQGLSGSLNIPMVRAALGNGGAPEFARILGKHRLSFQTTEFDSQSLTASAPLNPTSVLGLDVSLLELARSYLPFVADGQMPGQGLQVISKTIPFRQPTYQPSKAQKQSLVDPQIAGKIFTALSDQLVRSKVFGSTLQFFVKDKAIKTGTAEGVTGVKGVTAVAMLKRPNQPSLVIAGWFGNHDGEELPSATDASGTIAQTVKRVLESISPSPLS